MNFEIDDLLDMVDEWKRKLHEELQGMTEAEQAEFWKRAQEQRPIPKPTQSLGKSKPRKPKARK